jgi:hypothetical protein
VTKPKNKGVFAVHPARLAIEHERFLLFRELCQDNRFFVERQKDHQHYKTKVDTKAVIAEINERLPFPPELYDEPISDSNKANHGTLTKFEAGCHCHQCTGAKGAHERDRRKAQRELVGDG